jgi:Hydrazine synthase alpha subunit middle domain
MTLFRFRARATPLVVMAIPVLLAHAAALAQSPVHRPSIRHEAPILDVPVVFTQAPCNPPAAKSKSGTQGGQSQDPRQGARLVLLTPDGHTRVLTSSFHSACDPDVSVDGKHLLFAGKPGKRDDWNIFELDLESSTTRQITRDAGQCRSPIYTSSFYMITEKQPWEQIAFVSTRANAADERDGSPATSLYTCKLDGSFLQRITYNLASDLDPAILEDGRLVYATWRRATFDDGPRGRLTLETINTDGSDRAPLVGRQTSHAQRMPCVTANGSVIFVETDGTTCEGAGSLSSVSLRRPLHSYRTITAPRDGLFASPAPLPDGRILVSWRPAGGSNSLGLYRLDPATGQRERILDDPRYHEFQARAVHPRPLPDGRSSVVSPDDPLAEFYCMNAYNTDLENPSWLAKGSVKRLRVIEGLPEPLGGKNRASSSAAPRLAARRILAEVPVASDGSFHLSVPASTPIQLQILDDQGLALRSCGWIWARNHQAQGCIGCHEDPELTPVNRVPDALKTDVAVVAVPLKRRIAVDFASDVAPIIARRCAACHRAGQQAPDLDQAAAPADARLHTLYEALIAPNKESGLGKHVHPGRSRTSPLVWHIVGRNTSRPWDGAAVRGVVKPIPPGKSPGLSEAEKQTIIRWIDLGARFAVRPEARAAAKTGSHQ